MVFCPAVGGAVPLPPAQMPAAGGRAFNSSRYPRIVISITSGRTPNVSASPLFASAIVRGLMAQCLHRFLTALMVSRLALALSAILGSAA
jgi:hypothetical protein